MPPAIVAAGIGAAGALGGTIVASKAANKASRYQYDAQREAMQYQRDRDAAAKTERDEAYRRYKDDYDAWLYRNYGVKPKGWTGSNAFSKEQAVPRGQRPTPMGGPVVDPTGAPAPGGQTLGDIVYGHDPAAGSPSAPPIPTPPTGPPAGPPTGLAPAPGMTIRDMAQPGEWNDWRNYGLA